MNLKLKQLYLNRLEDDPANDMDSFLEPQSRREPLSEHDLTSKVLMLVLAGILVWLLIIVPMISQ